MRQLFYLLGISLLFLLNGCGAYFHQPMTTRRARLGPETPINRDLVSMPAPKEKIVAAVYKFRDQTGQYKPSETGANWSTAITQGATTILLRALEESGWFIPIERENVGNLLNERKIIRSSRKQYNTEEQQLLPPLLFAGIILEGGIISYESNVVTGGAGLRYFGTGGSGQYREDRVTVYLRAVSTSNSKILKTVYTTKSILSQKVDFGIFRYVKFKRLLEAETGFTYNEPTEMAVTEAIEKAVISLVIEGIEENLWALDKPADTTQSVLKDYRWEKAHKHQIDEFGRLLKADRRKRFSVGVSTGLARIDGDYPNPLNRAIGRITIEKILSPAFGLNWNTGLLRLKTENVYDADILESGLSLQWRILPTDQFTPFIYGGLGLVYETQRNKFSTHELIPKAIAGAGIEYLLKNGIGLNLAIGNQLLLNDEFDGLKQGNYNDMYWTGTVGLKYYFGR